MTDADTQSHVRTWLVAFAVCVAAVVISIAYVDRPVAEYVQAHVYGTALFNVTSRALGWSIGALVAMFLFLGGSGVWAASGRRLGAWTRTPLVCSLSAVCAVAIAVLLKYAFGRSWVYPTYVVDHIYAFHPFSGAPHYKAFPSATTATAAAILTTLWVRVPRARIASVMLLLLIAIALVISHGHWVADVIAGAFVGACVGSAVSRAALPPHR